MVLLDDIVIGIAAGVTTTTLIILGVLLSRYRALVAESRRSTELAKNIFDSMTARFNIQDARIVDLMARMDVYSVRKNPLVTSVTPTLAVTSPPVSQNITPHVMQSQPLSQTQPAVVLPTTPLGKTTNDTEIIILRALEQGPKMSGQILAVIHAERNPNMTREHNARLLKGLYERGLVRRTDAGKPFVYEITDAGRNFVKGGGV